METTVRLFPNRRSNSRPCWLDDDVGIESFGTGKCGDGVDGGENCDVRRGGDGDRPRPRPRPRAGSRARQGARRLRERAKRDANRATSARGGAAHRRRTGGRPKPSSANRHFDVNSPRSVGDADQAAYWNGPGGRHWTDRQRGAGRDSCAGPRAALIARAASRRASASSTSVAAAARRRWRSRRKSAPPAASSASTFRRRWSRGRKSGRGATSRRADSSSPTRRSHPFSPGGADLLFSRFGVMFFADPAQSSPTCARG